MLGPSGAGKDTLIAGAARARPDLVWARRAVTRPPDAGGEPFESLTVDEFLRRRAAGEFALHWAAHGRLYGVPASIRDALAAGRPVIFNGSRAALPDARRAFPELRAIFVTAPEAVLAARLAARGREDAAEIRARLARAALAPLGAPPPGAGVIVNDGTVEAGVARLLALLAPAESDGRGATGGRNR